MAEIRLTPAERAILVNQYRILTKLDPDYAQYHHLEKKIMILESGFEGDYGFVLGRFVESLVPAEVLTYANDVLVMMSNILDFEQELVGDYDLTRVRQVQFDARDEADYLSAAEYLFADDMNHFPGVTSVVNSHHATLGHYDRMLQPYRKAIQEFAWDVDAAKATLDAGVHRSTE